MKKNILILLVSLSTFSLFAQRTINMNFDLYQNAANNIIAMENNFPIIYSGNVGGNSYYFELEQPTVEFNQNFMKMIAILKINTTPTGYLELEIQPSIYVNYSLSTDNVTAFLQNLPNYINSNFPQIPQWIKDKIIEHYQSLQLEMYPAKLLNYAESLIPNFLAIEISNIDFSLRSLSGKLQIGISFVAAGIAPNYQCYTFNHNFVKITSNVQVDIKRLTLVTGGGTIIYDFNGTMPIQKGGEVVFNVTNPNNYWITNQSGRRIRVLLQSNIRGTFLRVYSADYVPDNDQWMLKPMLVTFD
ncbi:MAG: hypothetical protein NZM09_07195 [Ignavibacterium sp.]|nr:hypothetical protein [Ignavibacterium sp.]MDW8375467.1 hypothetical protein [Ignavibacteriales bacterium]